MYFYDRKYHLRKYEYLTRGGVTYKQIWYGVYKPCKSGAFGDYIDPTNPNYPTLKDALNAMNKHHEASKHKGATIY